MNKDKKLVIKCVVCKEKIFITPEELKAGKYKDQYLIRSSGDNALTAIQMGSLCENCLKLSLEKRVVFK